MFPPKQPFFAREAAWGKVLTLDKLQRRGWHLPNRCYLCGQDEESIHHILLNCPMVNPLWDFFFYLIGFSRVFPKTVKDALINWKSVDVQKLKHSFVSNWWSWNSLYIGEEISSLIGFLEWLASH